jgi:hypothetical protein
LPFRAKVVFKLGNRRQHIEHEPAGGGTGINILIDDQEVDTFGLEAFSQLSQVKGYTNIPSVF